MSDARAVVSLTDVLRPVSRPESVAADRTYRILGARWYAKGLYVKDIKGGSSIRANRLYRVVVGDFVYNRLFAWKGSFAVATHDDDGCYVSNEFLCFEADPDRLDADYLRYCFSRESVWTEVLGLSSGSTPTSRNRLKGEQFLAMRIALPPVGEQHDIVTWLRRLGVLLQEARVLREQNLIATRALMQAAEARYFPDNGDMSGWPKLGTVVEWIENGWSPQCDAEPATNGEWGVLKVGAVSSGRFVWDENKKLPAALVARPDLAVRKGDFLVGRANTTGLVGACAIVDADHPHLMLCDKIFRLHFKPAAGVHTRYLAYALKSRAARRQIEGMVSGTSSTMKNISKPKLLAIRLPIPTPELQTAIVGEFDEIQTRLERAEAIGKATATQLDAILPSVLQTLFAAA